VSGIVGIVMKDGGGRDALTRAISAMKRAIAHRGDVVMPAFVDEEAGVALATRGRDAFSRVAPEAQAAHDDVVVVGDLRLDERSALARAVSCSLDETRALSDAALVARAFRRYGREVARHLEGDFAFAAWDRRARTLLLARDLAGARPLVVVERPRFFAFASEVRALLAFDEVPRAIDETRLADFLVDARLEASDRTRTFFAHIARHPAGHTRVVARGASTLFAHRALDDDVQETPRALSRAAVDDAIVRFAAVFGQAVDDRLAHARAGAMLSGGVDSSAIVARATTARARDGLPPLPTFSSTWAREARDDACPDRPFVDEMHRAFAGALAPHTLTPDDSAQRGEAIARFVDESDDPYDSYMGALPLPLFLAARDAGVRTLATGIDGDLVLSQARAGFRFAIREGRLAFALEAARAGASPDDGALSTLLSSGVVPFLLQDLVAPRVPAALRALRRRRAFDDAAARIVEEAPLAAPLVARTGLRARLAHTLARPWEQSRMRRSPNALHVERLRWPIVQAACERYDRAAARAGLVVTHPLFDARLLACLVSMPWPATFTHGLPKSLLRDPRVAALPPGVSRREQSPAPHAPFMVRAARDLVAARPRLFSVALDRHADMIDRGALRAAHERLTRGDPNAAPHVWSASFVLAFLERFRT